MPERLITLICPPATPPYSAGSTPLTICTSEIESRLITEIWFWPPYCDSDRASGFEFASVPSTVMPVPPAATPFICTMPSPLTFTPAVRLIRFVRLRRLTGSSRTSCEPRLSDCSDAAVSMSGASPATVTVSAIAPTSSVNVWRTVWPAPSCMPRFCSVLKPVNSILTVVRAGRQRREHELAVRIGHAFARNAGAFVRGDDGRARDHRIRRIADESDERRRRDLRACGN